MKTFTKLVIVGVALACVSKLQPPTFVTPPRRSIALPVAATAAVTLSAAPAFSDPIGDAAKKLATASYPFLKDVDWNSGDLTRTVLTKPGDASAEYWAKAVAKAIDMGAAMDGDLLKLGVDAHHLAIISAAQDPRGVTSLTSYENILAAIGRMIASVPESKTMDVYDSFSRLVDGQVPAYLMKQVKEADAKAAYQALMEFKDVVKSNPITPVAVGAPSNPKIEAAAEKLASKAYPFLNEVAWNSDVYLKTSGYSGSSQKVLAAIDKALVMGSTMNAGALKEAAKAHVKAIENMDDKGVATQADFAAILAGLGKAIASVPEKTVMDVFTSFGGAVNSNVPAYLLSTVASKDAQLAYNGLMQFKDVVKDAQVAR